MANNRDDMQFDERRYDRGGRHAEPRRAPQQHRQEPDVRMRARIDPDWDERKFADGDDYEEENGMLVPPVLFWCTVAITAIMLVMVVFLGYRLVKSGNNSAALELAEQQITQYEAEIGSLRDELTAAKDETAKLQAEIDQLKAAPEQEQEPEAPKEPETEEPKAPEEPEDKYWLDLSGHSEIEMRPRNLFSDYKTYYVNATTLNVRSGNGTEYKLLFTAKKGDVAKVAAIEGQWAFINSGDKMGWAKLEYLSLTAPEGAAEKPAEKPKTEATSGNLA